MQQNLQDVGRVVLQKMALAMKNFNYWAKAQSLVFACTPPLPKASLCEIGGIMYEQ